MHEQWTATEIYVPQSRWGKAFYVFLATALLCPLATFGAIDVLSSDDEYQGPEICTTTPRGIDTPMGRLYIGEEGEQDMSDSNKAQIVDFLKEIPGLVKVSCE